MLPRRWRIPVGAIALLCLLACGGLGWTYAGDRAIGGTEQAIAEHLQARLGPHPWAIELMTAPGHAPVLAVATVAIAALAYRRDEPRLAVFALLAVPAVALCAQAAKLLVDRHINGDVLAYPSGHTAGATAIVVVAMFVLGRYAVPGGTVILVVAFGLVGGGFHYPTDTLGGFLLAVGTVLAVALTIDGVADRSVRPAEGAL